MTDDYTCWSKYCPRHATWEHTITRPDGAEVHHKYCDEHAQAYWSRKAPPPSKRVISELRAQVTDLERRLRRVREALGG